MIKKTFTILLVLAMLLSMAASGGAEPGSSDPPVALEPYAIGDPCTIVYDPGAHGAWTAASKTFSVLEGDPTPAFADPPGETGWEFTGWSPQVPATAEGDATYTAMWYESHYTGLGNEQVLSFDVDDDLSITLRASGFERSRVISITVTEKYYSPPKVSVIDHYPYRDGSYWDRTSTVRGVDVILYVDVAGYENLSNIFNDTAANIGDRRYYLIYDSGEHGEFSDGVNRIIHLGIRDNSDVQAPSLIPAGSITPGWHLAGWAPAWAPGGKMHGNLYYTAQYEKQTYTVTYDANGGTGAPIDANSYAAGDTVAVPGAMPARAGYAFAGWLYGGSTYAAASTFTMPAENVTFVADWTPDLVDALIVTYAKNTADSKPLKRGDYFTVGTYFSIKQDSNAAILTASYDGSLFEYAGVTPESGVMVLNTKTGAGTVSFTIISMDYDLQALLNILFKVKDDAVFAGGKEEISAVAEFVVKDAADVKSIKTLAGSTDVPTTNRMPGDTNDDGVIDLIDLSNMIDWFGINDSDPDWNTLYFFFDFNENGEIDISDISTVARMIS